MLTDEDLKIKLTKIDECLDAIFTKPDFKSSESELAYFQLLIGGGNLCKGIRTSCQDSEGESISLFNDMLDLIEQMELFSKNRWRLMLFLYCHLFELKLIPRMLYNLLILKENGQYKERPFPKRNSTQERSPQYKIKDLQLFLKKNDMQDFGLLLDEIYNEEIRNTFFHSDYNFSDTGLIINCNRNFNQKEIDFNNLGFALNLMFCFFNSFLKTWDKYLKNYSGYAFKHNGLTVKLKTDRNTGRLNGLEMGYF